MTVALLLAFMLSGEPSSVAEPRLPPELRASCRRIATTLSGLDAGFEPRITAGVVGHALDRDGRPGCRVQASIATSRLEKGHVDPYETLRRAFETDDWVEDPEFLADGPGTSAFAYRQTSKGVLCVFSLGAPSHLDDAGAIAVAPDYRIDARCVSAANAPEGG